MGGPGLISRGSSGGVVVLSSLTPPSLGTVSRKMLRSDVGKVVSADGRAHLFPQSSPLGPRLRLLVDSQPEAGVFCCFVLGRVRRATSSREVEAGWRCTPPPFCQHCPMGHHSLAWLGGKDADYIIPMGAFLPLWGGWSETQRCLCRPVVWEQPAPSSLGGDQGHTRHWPKMQSWKGRRDLSPEQLVVRGLSPALLR